jgi:Xaa-Pro aminopeptidase
MLNTERLERAQARMREQGIDAYMVLTHDDYVYFFGEDRYQPRAIIPKSGPPIVVTFRGEEDEVRQNLGTDRVRIFGSVGQQIKDVVESMRALMGEGQRLTVGMQMGFFTPHFLVSLFQKANPYADVVDIAPVMDELRMVKDPAEVALIQKAADIAQLGMTVATQHLKPGVQECDVATEVEYAMRKAGGQGTAVPVFVNSGIRSAWLHGTATDKAIQAGDLVVINLVPRYQGYCANMCRTFVVGEPDAQQQKMFDIFVQAQQAAVSAMKPGVKNRALDEAAHAVFEANGFGEHYVFGTSHGIGLLFEETPMPTIHPPHGQVALKAGMTLTAGHSVFAIPGYGGVRVEDTYHLTESGPVALTHFPKQLALPS